MPSVNYVDDLRQKINKNNIVSLQILKIKYNQRCYYNRQNLEI